MSSKNETKPLAEITAPSTANVNAIPWPTAFQATNAIGSRSFLINGKLYTSAGTQSIDSSHSL